MSSILKIIVRQSLIVIAEGCLMMLTADIYAQS